MALDRKIVRRSLTDGNEISFRADDQIGNETVELLRFVIPARKITRWALDEKNRAWLFWKEWGIDRRNPEELVLLIEEVALHAAFVKRHGDCWGQRYEQTMLVRGPNGKEARLLVAWIDDGYTMRMTIVHIDEKRRSNESR